MKKNLISILTNLFNNCQKEIKIIYFIKLLILQPLSLISKIYLKQKNLVSCQHKGFLLLDNECEARRYLYSLDFKNMFLLKISNKN